MSSINARVSSSEIDGINRAPPAAPGIVSRMPIPLNLKVRLMIARSSLIDDFADSYRSEKNVRKSRYADAPKVAGHVD